MISVRQFLTSKNCISECTQKGERVKQTELIRGEVLFEHIFPFSYETNLDVLPHVRVYNFQVIKYILNHTESIEKL